MAFLETDFPHGVSYGVAGGPAHSTGIIIYGSGHEKRNRNWSEPLGVWDAATGIRTQAQLDDLVAFFRIADGMANGFRWKDFNDYLVTTANGRLGTGAIGTGVASYPLYKRYSVSGTTRDRRIAKPHPGSVIVYKNGTPVAEGSGSGQISINTTTGLVTFVTPFPTGSDTLTWAGEFRVPARFGVDEMKASLDSHELYSWGAIPVREIRLRGLVY